ncbi:hypothetical protein P4B35_04500 [Pontiellaceae bacterium B12227]|nr:hypothetical protein [Pontiellaceae bacterium B12227]
MKAQPVKVFMAAGLAFGISATALADCNGGYLWTKGGQKVRITAGDGIPDPINVYPRHVKGQNFTFAITDSDSNVLVYTQDNTIDLEGAGAGTCRIYGIAYAGDFAMPTGVSVHSLTASECLSVSRNSIAVVRTAAKVLDGGWIITDGRGRSSVKINLSNPYPVRAYSANKAAADSNYSYVITDNKGMVLAYPPANQFDFSGAPAGICRIYGVSHTGSLVDTTGISIQEVVSDEDQQQLSKNYIRVIRSEK